MAHAPQAYDLLVKALEDKNAANAALAQAHSQLEDLKETLARARQAEHDADEREYRLMDDLREMGKKVNDRKAHILQVYACHSHPAGIVYIPQHTCWSQRITLLALMMCSQ